MKAKYLGLDLSSPVVVSSSPYTANLANIEQCVRNGAGAVVLKSIFEEQIIRHAAALDYASQQGMGDSGEYLERYIGDAYKGEFLKLVADARTTECPSSPASTASLRPKRGPTMPSLWSRPAPRRWS